MTETLSTLLLHPSVSGFLDYPRVALGIPDDDYNDTHTHTTHCLETSVVFSTNESSIPITGSSESTRESIIAIITITRIDDEIVSWFPRVLTWAQPCLLWPALLSVTSLTAGPPLSVSGCCRSCCYSSIHPPSAATSQSKRPAQPGSLSSPRDCHQRTQTFATAGFCVHTLGLKQTGLSASTHSVDCLHPFLTLVPVSFSTFNLHQSVSHSRALSSPLASVTPTSAAVQPN